MTTRRRFLQQGAVALAFMGLRQRLSAGQALRSTVDAPGYGPLQRDVRGILEIPAGFEYRVFSRTGERMDDGFVVPAAHDGMGAFTGPNGTTVLVRNHELSFDRLNEGAFGPRGAFASRLASDRFYDAAPTPGGTTTLVYNTREKRLERHFLSLAGTVRNCRGGATPWNTWISCEESVQLAEGGHRKNHGFPFEVSASSQSPVDPTPLTAMGRFNHEAIAVDRRSGAVYQTEDRDDGLFYRFLPTERGAPVRGGRLQALAIRDMKSADTSNWARTRIPLGRDLDVSWIDLQNVESPRDDLRSQGFTKGAARFARGEGMWVSGDAVLFACTNGGLSRVGQIWRYTPSPHEGAKEEAEQPGRIQLFIEPNDRNRFDMGDNITVAPWGDMIVCEDGPRGNCLVAITPQGRLYRLARNVMNSSEFAGSTFSPDGSTLFVNIQTPGLTLAITGPWREPM